MTMPGWFLDELAHAGSEHLDPDYVPGYDQKAATDPNEDLLPLRELGLKPSDTLLDFGSGTGTFALAVAPFVKQVIATDVSEPILAVFREKLSRSGVENIQIQQAGFLSYAHQGPPVDVVYTRHALHHLPDFWKGVALNRMASILKPGGVLYLRDLVYSFDLPMTEQVIEQWLSGAADDASRGWTRGELETHLRDEHSTFSWLLEPMIERAGFTIQDIEHKRSIYSRYICIRNGVAS